MAQPEYWSDELEGNLKDVYDCLERLPLVIIPRESDRPLARARHQEEQTTKILNYRKKWLSVMAQFFKLKFHDTIYSKIAEKLMKTLVNLKDIDIDEELYKRLVATLIQPIITTILDLEEEPCKKYKEQQELRVEFVHKLLQFNMIIEWEEEYFEEQPNVQTSDEVSQSTQPNVSQLRVRKTITHENLNILTEESKQILDILFGALLKFSKLASSCDMDIGGAIYEIINITYVVRLLHQHMDEIRSNIQLLGLPNTPTSGQQTNRLVTSQTPNQPSIEKQTFHEFENLIKECLDMLDATMPLVIFKDQLMRLFVQLKILIPFIK